MARTLLPREGEAALRRRQREALAEAHDWLSIEAGSREARDFILLAERLRLATTALDHITGRAGVEDMLDADVVEQVLVRLAELENEVPFAIKTTAAQHYRRVLRQRKQAQHHPSPHDGIGRATRPVGGIRHPCLRLRS